MNRIGISIRVGCNPRFPVDAVHDPDYAHYNSIFELPAHRMREVKRFFEDYKALEEKTVVVGDFLDRTTALESITQAIERYRQHRHTLVHAHRQDGA